MINQHSVDEVVTWLGNGAPPLTNPSDIVKTICERLHQAGLPIERAALFIYSLSPSNSGRRYLWSPTGGVEMTEAEIGLFLTRIYLDNPLPHVIENRRAIRRKLVDPACPLDYPVLEELRTEGFTDYYVQPLPYLTGGTNAVSWSSKAPGGFPDEALAVLDRVNGPIARLTEALVLHLNATAVVSAYVGRNSGEQVLSGKIHRGDGEEIDGAILFTDISGFTQLSNELSGPEVVRLINDVFDQLVPAIENHGGEVLKFVGDGCLAIFSDPAHGMPENASAARNAVADAERTFDAAPVSARTTFRSAIHAGRFHYGNIGGANRLDFTAIGRPVNYAARLADAASRLNIRRVASELVAPHIGVPAHLAETTEMKGFDGPQPVYTYGAG